MDTGSNTKTYKKGGKTITETTTVKGKKTIIEKVWREGKKTITETTTKEGNRTSVNTFVKHDPTVSKTTSKIEKSTVYTSPVKESHTSITKRVYSSGGGERSTISKVYSSGGRSDLSATKNVTYMAGAGSSTARVEEGKKGSRTVTYYKTISGTEGEEAKLKRSIGKGEGKTTYYKESTVHRSSSGGGMKMSSHSSSFQEGRNMRKTMNTELHEVDEGTHNIEDKRNKIRTSTTGSNVFSRLTAPTKATIGKSKKQEDREQREEWRKTINSQLDYEESLMNMGGFVMKDQRYKRTAAQRSPQTAKASKTTTTKRVKQTISESTHRQNQEMNSQTFTSRSILIP
jgi:hypothetical protein